MRPQIVRRLSSDTCIVSPSLLAKQIDTLLVWCDFISRSMAAWCVALEAPMRPELACGRRPDFFVEFRAGEIVSVVGHQTHLKSCAACLLVSPVGVPIHAFEGCL